MKFFSQLVSIVTFLRWQKYVSYTFHNLEITFQGTGPGPEAINAKMEEFSHATLPPLSPYL